MININNGMSGLDSNDDTSAVTVATKNSYERKYNEPIDISEGVFDMDPEQAVDHPKQSKHWKYKPKLTSQEASWKIDNK